MGEYRAAYIPGAPDSTSGGIVLTLPEHADLPDDELLAEARRCMAEIGIDGDPVIGEWTEN